MSPCGPRITELAAPPIVGRRYLVPTVERPFAWETAQVWPVFLPRHRENAFFQFTAEHYHVDPRFVDGRAWRRLTSRGRWRAQANGYDGDVGGFATAQATPVARWLSGPGDFPLQEVTWRPLTCRRVAITYLFGSHTGPKELRAAFAGQTCPASRHGWVCPHQHAQLGSIAPDADGVITCPLHGLRIRAADGLCLTGE